MQIGDPPATAGGTDPTQDQTWKNIATEMKRCPTCNRTYTDLSLNFCLEDGTPLATDATPRPIQMRPSDILVQEIHPSLHQLRFITHLPPTPTADSTSAAATATTVVAHAASRGTTRKNPTRSGGYSADLQQSDRNRRRPVVMLIALASLGANTNNSNLNANTRNDNRNSNIYGRTQTQHEHE